MPNRSSSRVKQKQRKQIEGEAYWDGGYAGNPTITPLVRKSDAHDTILVQINPTERANTPRSAAEIEVRSGSNSEASLLARHVCCTLKRWCNRPAQLVDS